MYHETKSARRKRLRTEILTPAQVTRDTKLCARFVGCYARFSRRRKRQMKAEWIGGYLDCYGVERSFKGVSWISFYPHEVEGEGQIPFMLFLHGLIKRPEAGNG